MAGYNHVLTQHFPGLDGLLRCPICNRTYSDPRILPCQHSYCVDCLYQLVDVSKFTSDNLVWNLTCPVCRCETSVKDFQELPHDQRIFELQDAMRNMVNMMKTTTSATCDICKLEDLRMPAACYCEQCRGYLCQACYDWHSSKTAYMAHRIEEVRVEDSDTVSSLTCSEHKLSVLYICLQCERPLCATCITRYCLDHQIKDVKVVMKVRQDEMSKMISQFQEQITKLLDQEMNLTSAKDRNDDIFKNTENTIRMHAQDMLTVVQHNGGKALEDLYNSHDKLQKDIGMELRTHDIQSRLLQNLEMAARAVSQPGKEMLLLMAYSTIQARAPKSINATAIADLASSRVQFKPKTGLDIGNIQITKGEKKRPKITPRSSKMAVASRKGETVTKSRSPRAPQTPQVDDIPDLSTSIEQKWVRKSLEYGWDVAFVPQGVVASDHDQVRCKVELRSLAGTLDADSHKHTMDLCEPCGIVYSEQLGYILVAEPSLGCLQALLPDKLTHKKRFHLTHANSPTGIATTRGGQLVVTEAGSRTGVSIHDLQGGCVKAWGSWTREDVQLDQPYYVCTDQNDRIIVSDTGNHCVKIFDNSGQMLLKFGQSMTGESFKRPGGVCATPQNNILVVHSYRSNCNRVSLFSSDGQLIGKLLDLDKSQGELRSVAYHNSTLALVSENATYLYSLDETI